MHSPQWIGPGPPSNILAEFNNLQATSMALDSAGKIALLASRRQWVIVNIDTVLSEGAGSASTRRIDRVGKSDVGCALWNPSAAQSSTFAATTVQQIDIMTLQPTTITAQTTLKGHSRNISDIDWSPFEENNLASASMDNLTFVWDVREPKKPKIALQAVCTSQGYTFYTATVAFAPEFQFSMHANCANSSVSQVKWNRFMPVRLATAHTGDIRIWDIRNPQVPVTYISAHAGKIYGVDWSRSTTCRLVTCSQDTHIKIWDTADPKRPHQIFNAEYPVWRARYTPFGRGLVSAVLPQFLRAGDPKPPVLWAMDNGGAPIHRFAGHTEVVLDFHWRTQDNDYQLVTWSKDGTLRLWTLDVHLLAGKTYSNLYSKASGMSNDQLLDAEKQTKGLQVSPTKDGTNEEEVDVHHQLGRFVKSRCGERIQILLLIFLETVHMPYNWFSLSTVFMHRGCPANEQDCSFLFSNTSACESICMPDGTLCPNATFNDEWFTVTREWGLVCDRRHLGNLITSLNLSAQILGAFIGGQLANLLGRKPVAYGFLLAAATLHGVTGLCNSAQIYMGLRFLTMMCVTASMWAKIALMIEIAPPKLRPFVTVAGGWGLGGLTLGIMGFYVRAWRKLCVTASVCVIPFLLSWFFVPESPKWLFTTGKVDQAEVIYKRFARLNGKEIPDMQKLHHLATLEEAAVKLQKRYTYLDLFKRWRVAKAVLICAFGCLISAAMWWSTALNVGDLTGNFYVNFFLIQSLNSPAILIYKAPWAWYVKRRKIILLNMIFASVVSAIVTITLAVGVDLGTIRTILTLYAFVAINLAWISIRLLAAEHIPTVIRNIGLGAVSTVERAGASIAPLLLIIASGTGRYFLSGFMCIASVVVTGLVLLLKETKGQYLINQLHDEYHEEDLDEGNMEKKANGPSDAVELTTVERWAKKDGVMTGY